MDRKDDMDLESLKNMLSDVPDTDEFDLDSIIAEVSGQAPAKAAEPMPKASAEPEKPVEPQPAPAAETKAEEPKTAPRNKKDKTAKKAAETAAAEHESVEEAREARIAAREQKMAERERRTAQKIAERQARRGNIMYMQDWVARLDAFLQFNEEEVLHHKGKVTAAIAKAFAESEFEKYRVIQDRQYQSDFDRLVASTEDKD